MERSGSEVFRRGRIRGQRRRNFFTLPLEFRREPGLGVRSRLRIANGQAAKPNRRLRAGDELEIRRPLGRRQRLKVLALADRHMAKAEARRLYQDLTPPPTPEEIELRRQERLFHAAMTPPHSPDKRQRRALRTMRGKA